MPATSTEEQLSELKKELSDICSSLLCFDLEEGDDVIELQIAVEKDIRLLFPSNQGTFFFIRVCLHQLHRLIKV